MAYSCVKVLFEIGHEASIRTKRTPEGFTHDWEVYVRGADNSDIFHFVDKVVFHLHETFPKPKRVVKDPPYSVKESGYAGFNLPIEVYFKNSDEPKKVRFNYDLHLQTSGPPISNVLREQFVFPNPAEDLRRRLIKGGGVGVLGSESGFHVVTSDKLPPPSVDEVTSHKHPVPPLVGKPKLSGSDPNKKHKVKEGKTDESRVSNSFHDLFGPPIKTAKVSPDPKKSSSSHSSPKVSPVSKSSKPLEKSSNDKEKSSKSSKHGSQREGKEPSERSSSSSKEEKKDKEKTRDKEKNKDKPPKRPSTPVKPPSTPPKRPSTPPKRPPSPPKRPPSPAKLLAPPPPSKISTSPKHSSTPKPSKDESKKNSSEESKSRSETKSNESSKSEKKKKDKKNRDEKPKKDKHKDHEKGSEKSVKAEKMRDSKDRDANKKLEKETIKEPEKPREKEKDKSKHSDGDKEKQRHKHKKKDKSNKDKDRDKEKEKDKSSKKSSENKVTEIRDKEKNGLANESSRGSVDTTSDISAPHKKQAASSPSPSPVRAASSPMKPSPTPEKPVSSVPIKEKLKRPPISDDSCDSHSSALSADDDVEPPVSRIKTVKSQESGLVSVESKSCVLPVTEPPRPNSRSEVVKPKSENSSQERNSLNKSNSKQKEKSSKKSKERESGSGDGEKSEKDSKKSKRKRSNRVIEDGDSARNNIEAPTKIPKLEIKSEELSPDPELLEEKAAVEEMEIKDESDSEELPPPTTTHLTEEYVSQLRELQHKIMTLEDNAELQRVVQVIAETGQYEITKKTFDFDLCALDRSTVERLQEFFAPS